MSVLLIAGSPSERSRTAALLSAAGQRLEFRGALVDTLRVRDLPPQALLLADFGNPAVIRATAQVAEADIVVVATAHEKASVLSFVLQGYTTEEVGKAMNAEGIAVRTGHHCAQPILRRFGLETTVRPSLAFYNTCEEVDRMIAVVRRLSSSRAKS